MAEKVVIVDYGSGNIRSIFNALRRSAGDGQEVSVSNEAAAIAGAQRLVLPGVGAFAECRRKLDASGLRESVVEAATGRGTPLLGVCVGMQILADEGREFETSRGLGLIPGVVRRIEFPEGCADAPNKLPHVGWTQIAPVGREGDGSKCSALFDGLPPKACFYFVHSYVFACAEASDVAATADYGEHFAAAVQRDNIFGCQFHPEKSAASGLRLLENFCRWKP